MPKNRRASLLLFLCISLMVYLVSCRGALTSEVSLALTQTALDPYVATKAAETPLPTEPLDWDDLLKITPTSAVAGALGILAPTITSTATPFIIQVNTARPTPTYPLNLFPPTRTPSLITTPNPLTTNTPAKISTTGTPSLGTPRPPMPGPT